MQHDRAGAMPQASQLDAPGPRPSRRTTHSLNRDRISQSGMEALAMTSWDQNFNEVDNCLFAWFKDKEVDCLK